MMTLAEAIEHAREQAQKACCPSCRDEHRQLAEWLEELMERRKGDSQNHNVPLEFVNAVAAMRDVARENSLHLHSFDRRGDAIKCECGMSLREYIAEKGCG